MELTFWNIAVLTWGIILTLSIPAGFFLAFVYYQWNNMARIMLIAEELNDIKDMREENARFREVAQAATHALDELRDEHDIENKAWMASVENSYSTTLYCMLSFIEKNIKEGRYYIIEPEKYKIQGYYNEKWNIVGEWVFENNTPRFYSSDKKGGNK